MTGAALTSLLSGNTVCVPHPSLTRWEWQEQHTAASPGTSTSGALFDEKRGTGHAVDPREQVGTWSLNTSGANSAVTHAYNTTFTWKVCKAGTAATTYGFCPGTTATIFATIKPNIVACGVPTLPL